MREVERDVLNLPGGANVSQMLTDSQYVSNVKVKIEQIPPTEVSKLPERL